MERVNRIYRHEIYQQELASIAKAEQTREYCGHDMQHFMDVARIAMILNVEQKLGFAKEILYAAALLHDIGRGREYREGVSHDEASAALAKEILPSCGYSPEEITCVCQAIQGHRLSTEGNGQRTPLGTLLHEADHLSRSCYSCPAESTCYWPKQKKNLKIRM